MTISDPAETSKTKKRPLLRVILLLLALLTSPLVCCGSIYFMESISSLTGFTLNIFRAEARVENVSDETLYITPITTTYREPMVIPQSAFIRQRDFPLRPGHSITLTYDSADLPLGGFAVCRANDDCRMLVADHSEVYYLYSFGELPELDPGWLRAIRSRPEYNFSVVLFPILSLLPVGLFLGWLYVIWQEKKRVG